MGNDPINFADPLGLEAYCFAIFEVTTKFNRVTGEQVGPSEWKYLYSFCRIDGRFVKTVLDPEPRPSGNNLTSVPANDRMKRFEREYDKCIQRRKKERDRMHDNHLAESITDAGKEALLFGAPAGALGGFVAGKKAGAALPPPGPVVAPVVGSMVGATSVGGGAFLLESGRNYIQGLIFDLENRKREHQAQDNPVCEGEAAAKVFNL